MPLAADVGTFAPGPPFEAIPESLWTPPSGTRMVYDSAQDDAYDALVIRDMQTEYGAYFKMQEPSGATVLTSRGPLFPAMTSTGVQAPNTGEGPIPTATDQGYTNRAWRFSNGATSSVGLQFTDQRLFEWLGKQQYSIEVWVLFEGIPRGGGGTGPFLLEKQPGSGWKLLSTANPATFLATRTGLTQDSATGASTGALSPIYLAWSWTHVVYTFDGANLTLYLNGQVAATSASTQDVLGANQGLRIGPSFDGLMSRLALYGNIVLTQAEVTEHYLAGSTSSFQVPITPRALPIRGLGPTSLIVPIWTVADAQPSTADATVTGVQALATATGQPGTVLITATGVQAASTATAQPGTVLVVATGTQAAATATAQPGTGLIVATGQQATATATAQPSSPTISLLGVQATATATGQAKDVWIQATGERALATATAQPGTPAITGNLTVTGVQATATATAQPGTPFVGILGTQASATATAQPSSANVSLLGVRAAATATGQAGTVRIVATGTQAQATATAQPGSPVVSILGVRALATATGQAGAVTYTSDVIGVRALATATAQPGAVAWTCLVVGDRALATATGQGGVVFAAGVGTPTQTNFTRFTINNSRTQAAQSGSKTNVTVGTGRTLART